MYQYLSGRLMEKSAVSAVIDVNGIGYQIHIPVSTFAALPEVGQTVKILIHFIVREDIQALFGFLTDEEREMFRHLISISGIGPKSAVTVLSGIPLPELKRAIVAGDLAVLTGISGIGRKTGERIIIELREKILIEDRRSPSIAAGKNISQGPLMEDSLQALIELGYRKQNAQDAIQKALKNLDKNGLSVADLVRASLKYV